MARGLKTGSVKKTNRIAAAETEWLRLRYTCCVQHSCMDDTELQECGEREVLVWGGAQEKPQPLR
jgi:hypothetical protein